jgi:hypothetical protein
MNSLFRSLFAACAIAVAPAAAIAQYAMDMRLDYPSYLQFESVSATIAIRNDTDRMLLVGGLRATAVVDFKITRNNGPVRRINNGLVLENVLIMPGQTREVAVDVGRYYDMQPMGQYEIKATFSTEGARFVSSPRIIDVVPGLELTSAIRPVANHPSRMRRYTLRYWNRKNREMLFLCAADEKEGVNYGVFTLGSMVRVFPPELNIDTAGNILVKHQADNGVFAYTTLKSTVDGVVMVRQQIKASDLKLPGGRKAD